MKNLDYSLDEDAHPRQGPSIFAVVLTSVVTSSAISLAVLFVTGNLSSNSVETVEENIVVPATQTVPSLIGIPTKTAKELLKVKDLRMVITDERADKSVERGTIIEQRPLPESDLEAGTKVEVIVSSGPAKVEIPDLEGKTLGEAKVLLKGTGIEIGQTTFEGDGLPGVISLIIPAAGTEVDEGIKLSVVAVPLDVPVPELIGMRTSKAKQAIKEAGFKVGKISWRYNEHKPANLVLAQDPAAGSRAVPDSEISLVLNPE